MILRICVFVVVFWNVQIVLGSAWVKQKNVSSLLVAGMIELLAIFEVVSLVCILLKTSLRTLILVYGVAVFISYIISWTCNWKKILKLFLKKGKITLIEVAIIGLILFQVAMLTFMTHTDDDDAMYVGEAVTTVQTDSLKQVDPYTGEIADGYNYRYLMSPFPIFNALLSKVAGIHPAIMAHTVFPILFIPIAYCVYSLIGERLFEKNERKRDLFLVFVNIFNICSYYSVYPASVFMLVRIWQGKAILASVILPLLFYLCLSLSEKNMTKRDFIRIFTTLVAGIMLSSMGVILGAILVGCFGITYLIIEKSWKKFLILGICCMPNVLASIVYILFR